MKRMTRFMAVGMCAVLVLAVAGCQRQSPQTAEPTVTPPAVKTAGKLVAGVDLSTPPFAGTDLGKRAGIDIDVAAALADKLGLEVSYVDVKPSEAATALAQGRADVVFSMALTGSESAQVTLSGTYITNAPAFFVTAEGTASVEPSLTIDTLSADKVGAQEGSESYWIIRDEVGPETIESFETLREAIEALDDGTIELVAGDAIVGAYIGRDFPDVRFAGQLGPGVPLAAAVSEGNTVLSDAVRTGLDELAADGILDFIRTKWVGTLPPLEVQEGDTAP